MPDGAVATSATAAVVLSAGLGAGPLALADVGTVSVDTLRTGWDKFEPGLSPADVSSADFGQQFATTVDGQIYAQPVVAGSTVIVATENNFVYGVDTETGDIKWSRSLGPAWPASNINCDGLTPNVGVTSTPVIDFSTGTVYVVAKADDGASPQNPTHKMHALDIATGIERAGRPVKIQGAPTNDPTRAFNAYTALQRPGLLLLDGVVYAAFGGMCDVQPYRGYVVGVSTAQHKLTALWTSAVGSSTGGVGIWQSGGGLVSDGPGQILLSTGNGVTPPVGPGHNPPNNLSESVVRLNVNANGSLSATDFFAPRNANELDNNDVDLGSGAPVGLPDSFGTATHPHLLLEIGKDGRLFLLDRDNLGGRAQGPGYTDAVVSMSGPFNGVWGHPAVWGGDGGYVYFVGSGGPLRAMKYGVDGSGTPVFSAVGTSQGVFGYTSGSPLVTSTGSQSGSALVWVVYASRTTGGNGELRAYDALPTNGVLHLRYSVAIGTAAKFTKVASDGNRIFVGTRDGKLFAFGRPSASALQTPGVDFGSVPVGGTASATATVTATKAVTITAVTTEPPFGATPPALPITLLAGQSLSVPVTVTPTDTGTTTGTLTYSTDTGPIGQSLQVNGTRAGLSAAPSTLDFDTVATGASKTLTADVTNTGTQSVTVTGTTAPSAPFTATGLPAAGTTILAGASVSVTVRYSPTVEGSNASAVTIRSTGGEVTIPVTGEAVTGVAVLTLAPTRLPFGKVAIGQSLSQSFTVTNTGNVTLTITKSNAPTGPFHDASPLPEGLRLGPGQSVTQTVTFTPTALGIATARYKITSDDGRGTQYVGLAGKGI